MVALTWRNTWREYWRPIAVVVALLAGLQYTQAVSYGFFHVLVEIFSIVVACTIFAVFWNARQFLDNTFYLLIGIGYLFVAFLDLLHSLSVGAVHIFPGYGTNLGNSAVGGGPHAAGFVAGRGLAVDGPEDPERLPLRGVHRDPGGPPVEPLPLARVSRLLRRWPGSDAFQDWLRDRHLRNVAGRRSVCSMRHRREFDANVFWLVAASIVLTIASELAFSLYREVTDGRTSSGTT